MKATDLLKQQHRDVTEMFESLKEATTETKREIFTELASTLVAHDAIEREIFYPACEKALGMTDELGESLVEHGVIEFSLYEADQAQGKSDFDFKCTVLREMVEHHVKEEERDFFPEVEEAIEESELATLGAQMEERFEAARDADYRKPLHKNLSLVMTGAMKAGQDKKAGPDKGLGNGRRAAHKHT